MCHTFALSPRRPESNETHPCAPPIAGSLACGVLVASRVRPRHRASPRAEPATSEGIAGLVAAVANADQKLQELGANIQAEQESVNKAIVDVQTARDNAAAAQSEVDASQAALKDANGGHLVARSSASTPSPPRPT